MGDWLLKNKSVEVIVNGGCNSACAATVLGAGKGRVRIENGGSIGVHQARNSETGQPSIAFTKYHADRLARLGLPASVVFAFKTVPPDAIYIMTSAELAAYGVKTG